MLSVLNCRSSLRSRTRAPTLPQLVPLCSQSLLLRLHLKDSTVQLYDLWNRVCHTLVQPPCLHVSDGNAWVCRDATDVALSLSEASSAPSWLVARCERPPDRPSCAQHSGNKRQLRAPHSDRRTCVAQRATTPAHS